MFNTMFWILGIWFLINFIWMWFKLDDRKLLKTFAWINVVAVIVGFWVFSAATHSTELMANWFTGLNWANVVLAILQFYFAYRHQNSQNQSNVHPA